MHATTLTGIAGIRRAGDGGRGPLAAPLAALLLAAVITAGCADAGDRNRAAFVLVDISGDYAAEIEKARALTGLLLAEMRSGDAIAVGFIDNASYTERNIIARARLDRRPSIANEQKERVRAQLEAFLERFSVPSGHSDITGGVLLARDFLRETDARHKRVYLLSNLEDNAPPQLKRDGPLELDGIDVVAVNVTREPDDNIDPRAYRQRLERWEQRVTAGGGDWRLVNELARLNELIALR